MMMTIKDYKSWLNTMLLNQDDNNGIFKQVQTKMIKNFQEQIKNHGQRKGSPKWEPLSKQVYNLKVKECGYTDIPLIATGEMLHGFVSDIKNNSMTIYNKKDYFKQHILGSSQRHVVQYRGSSRKVYIRGLPKRDMMYYTNSDILFCEHVCLNKIQDKING